MGMMWDWVAPAARVEWHCGDGPIYMLQRRSQHASSAQQHKHAPA